MKVTDPVVLEPTAIGAAEVPKVVTLGAVASGGTTTESANVFEVEVL